MADAALAGPDAARWEIDRKIVVAGAVIAITIAVRDLMNPLIFLG